MTQFLTKDTSGNWNTVPPVPAEKMADVNCHKFVLYVIRNISWEEMVSDSHTQKAAGVDFTYGERARKISDQEFVKITDKDSLLKLADTTCESGKAYAGQIMDSTTGEMAHSFILEKTVDGSYQCFDKQGFKFYPFSVKNLECFLDFVNEKGEKSYIGQKWRFVPIEN